MFSIDTTLVYLISRSDEEIQEPTGRWIKNHLQLNTTKTKEMVIDFRKQERDPSPLSINNVCVERVTSVKFLGTVISEDLSSAINTSALARKAQQQLHFLWKLQRNHLEEKLLASFYGVIIELVLMYCMSIWFVAWSAADKMAMKRRSKKVNGCLPRLLDNITSTRCIARANKILLSSLRGRELLAYLENLKLERRNWLPRNYLFSFEPPITHSETVSLTPVTKNWASICQKLPRFTAKKFIS